MTEVREERGKDKLALLEDYTVVDLETTGLDPESCHIIECGGARVRGGKIVAVFSELVDPGVFLDPFIVSLTGITDEMLTGKRGIEEVLPDFLGFIGSDTVLGHNVGFDAGFLRANARRVLGRPFPNDTLDTMRFSRRLFPEFEHHRLIDLTARLQVPAPLSHRALADAEQTAGCYEHIKAYMRSNGITEKTLCLKKRERCLPTFAEGCEKWLSACNFFPFVTK